jgi:hypothetical protein
MDRAFAKSILPCVTIAARLYLLKQLGPFRRSYFSSGLVFQLRGGGVVPIKRG